MTALIVTILLLIIGGFIAFAIYLQMKEQARLERLRKVALLNNQVRQIRRYIDDLPSQYQPKELRIWLYQRLMSVFDELLTTQPDESLSRRRRNLEEEMINFQSSKQKRRAKPVIDELEIMELKRLFEAVAQFVAFAKNNKQIEPDQAFRYESLMNFYRYKVMADFHAYLARQAFLTQKFDDAIAQYKEAISQLLPVQENPEAQPVIVQFQSIIDEIEADLELQKREAELELDEEEDAELDDEWNKFMNQDDFQKKKHF